ncbi:DNA/RNA nuclease SfsA [Bittarella massiliensis (ex Durand et al. 2017)]|uniref:DNA/RNA nuclease SfsA n=1 Tax=Bittarella massiliensis (ex Durand et al. 2017) TaxID=1720313 RepID=UPI001AA1082E|nr:DNA/RNA nuclease SfsA [Bittarella massiliensis (ex Durand et al. 2017)]MBO1679176.1 DNA/RNA nuclease SfsA [Bittarella massiliensis (ex Durand et al. 2017)]
MRYESVCRAVFLERPNRFVAWCDLAGERVRCHVKNTGRCGELLLPGARVVLQDRRGRAEGQKTQFSLVAVYKGEMLVNIDSQAPNAVVKEALLSGALALPGYQSPDLVRAEYPFGASRIDFYLQKGGRRALVEVKGVTLEEGGGLYFPDAPTQRGVKHIEELERARAQGWDAFLLFVAQLSPARFLSPNDRTHPQFGQALRRAAAAGVIPLCYDCRVAEDSLALGRPVEVRL